jgi:7-cyano-7-deazaguanine synthase
MERAIVLLSGGVDSAVTLWWAKDQGWDVQPLTFNYFGRPKREHIATQALVHKADVRPIQSVDLPFLKEVDDLRPSGFDNPALGESPEGYIPARNLIFYSLAAYFAELGGTRYLVGGHNGTDPESFPDASPKFFDHLNRLLAMSLWSHERSPVEVLVPLGGKSKEDVLRMGQKLGVPFELTWSCYWDQDVHCGSCVSCTERREAFAAIHVKDPVPYEANSRNRHAPSASKT